MADESDPAGGWLRDPRYDAGLVELERLDAAEAVLVAARTRVLAGLAARTSRDGWQGLAPYDSLLLDVAGTSRLGQVAAGSRLADAEHLHARLPRTLGLLDGGLLRAQQAAVVVEQTRDLSASVCAQLEQALLTGPALDRTVLLAPADLRRHVKRTVLRLDAQAVAARERTARRGRRVWVQTAQDGMALLCALLPAEQAHAAHARLTGSARQQRQSERQHADTAPTAAAAGAEAAAEPGVRTGAPGARTMDQLRADLLCDLLLTDTPLGTPTDAPAPAGGRRPAGSGVRIVVHVPLAVALGLSQDPGELQGHGPISAAHVRRLLPGATLQRACTDPTTGEVWHLDPTLTRLPAPQDRPSQDHADGEEAATPAPTRPAPVHDDRPTRSTDPTASPPPPVLPDVVLDAVRALAERPPPDALPAEPRHDPSAALARTVRTRDHRCDGIGCTRPADHCELDHHDPWPHGPTSRTNLRTRSQRCHHAKHHGWTVTVHTATGTGTGTGPSPTSTSSSTSSSPSPGPGLGPVSVWTSPGGRRYPVPHRRALDPPTP